MQLFVWNSQFLSGIIALRRGIHENRVHLVLQSAQKRSLLARRQPMPDADVLRARSMSLQEHCQRNRNVFAVAENDIVLVAARIAQRRQREIAACSPRQPNDSGTGFGFERRVIEQVGSERRLEREVIHGRMRVVPNRVRHAALGDAGDQHQNAQFSRRYRHGKSKFLSSPA